MTTLHFVLPVRTLNPLNGAWGASRGAIFMAAKRRKEHRSLAHARLRYEAATRGVKLTELVPCTVTLTRASSGRLDAHDALPASLKSCVDGIADALGVNDGAGLVTWRYAQKKAPRGVFGVLVVIETGAR